MGSQTGAGVQLAISVAAPATNDAAGYGALTFTTIGQLDKLGSFGAQAAKVEFQPLFGPKQKFKGSFDYGAVQPTGALDDTDAGQTMLTAAADNETNALNSYRVTYPNGAKRFFQGRCFGMPEGVDGADNMIMINPVVEICTKIVRVAGS